MNASRHLTTASWRLLGRLVDLVLIGSLRCGGSRRLRGKGYRVLTKGRKVEGSKPSDEKKLHSSLAPSSTSVRTLCAPSSRKCASKASAISRPIALPRCAASTPSTSIQPVG